MTRWLTFHALGLRWWVARERWMPAGYVCSVRGHKEAGWYDGPICGRCGCEMDFEEGA